MFGVIDTKVYLFIAIITTPILYVIDLLDKHEIVRDFLLQQSTNAQLAGMPEAMANLIVVPLVFMVDNPIGAIVGGLIWPVLLFLIFALVVIMAYSVLFPGLLKALCTADSRC